MSDLTQTQYVEARFAPGTKPWDITRFDQATWRNWRRAGTIPEKHWLGIVIDAQAAGMPVFPHDFVAHLVDAFSKATPDSRITETPGTAPASPATQAA